MEWIQTVLDYLLHIEVHLDYLITNYHHWTYVVLFLIIFIETGFIVMPFLPGDSLLFAIGAFCARGSLDSFSIGGLLIVAAIIGDTINYSVGKFVGHKIFDKESSLWFNKKNLDKAHSFYERYGAKTIILARFIPIVRSFAPFVAGIGEMTYKNFMLYNVVGAFLWVLSFISLGYFFGNLPFVQSNFKYVMLAIVVISTIPGVIEYYRERSKLKSEEVL